MGKEIILREYGCLGLRGESSGLDFAVIDKHAWLWLKDICLNQPEGKSTFLRLISRYGQECIQVRNYVGVLEAPSGVQIEILPKITESNKQSVEETRLILWKMLSRINDLPWKESEDAHLRTANRPIFELLIYKFLAQVSEIVRRGIRSDYARVEEEQRYLRGRLDVSKQIRRPPSQKHLFDVRYDKYLPNRAENRLIRSALKKVLSSSRSAANQRLARELFFSFDAILYSEDIQRDFSEWRNSRDMVYYQPSKPWCQLILSEQTPFLSPGDWKGVSMLFPMERLFEKYVAKQLSKEVDGSYSVTEQARSEYLVSHSKQEWFELRPDILIRKKKESMSVLDSKWKLIDSRKDNGEDKYKIHQSDMYQLFAYGNKYLNGKGELFLIYPKSEYFRVPLEIFEFTDDLKLWVIPYDLINDKFIIPESCEINKIFKHAKLNQVA